MNSLINITNGYYFTFLPTVTVQCTKDGYFIVVVAKDATLPNLDLDTISMYGEGPSCTYVDSNSEFAIYYFAVTQCGTLVRVRFQFSCFFFKQTLSNIKTKIPSIFATELFCICQRRRSLVLSSTKTLWYRFLMFYLGIWDKSPGTPHTSKASLFQISSY